MKVRPEDIVLMKCGALRTGLVATDPVVIYTKPHLRDCSIQTSREKNGSSSSKLLILSVFAL